MDRTLTGKRIKLIRMEDPYTNLKNGDEGTINGIDDMGNVLVKWDNGSSLSILPEIDEYEILESVNEGIVSFLLGAFLAGKLYFWLSKIYREHELDTMKKGLLKSTMDSIKIYSDSRVIETGEDALRVSEFGDRYYITLYGENQPNLRIFKNEKILIISNSSNKISVKINLKDNEYDYFIKIVKSRLDEKINNLKYLKMFEEFSSIKDVNSLIVGKKYKITSPIYDDYDEGLEPEKSNVLVVQKSRDGYILRDLDTDDVYRRNYSYLSDCEVEEVEEDI